jgi:hypothetical protein
MGRSQVLYNRTKGRYKSRGGGRGVRGGSDAATPVGGTSGKKQIERVHEEGDTELDDKVDYQEQKHRQQINEAMILLADSSISGQRHAHYYDRIKKEREEKDAAAFSILEAGGSINVPSMAASFQKMKRFERLKMPGHLVSIAFRKPDEFDGDDFGSDGSGDERMSTIKGKKIGFKSPLDDDEASYTSVTIAGTRNRATILSDGQVEVRPKPNQKGEASVVTVSTKSDHPPDNASIRAAGSTTSTSKHIIMQMISEDGPDEDRYLVLQASSSDGTRGGDPGEVNHQTTKFDDVSYKETVDERSELEAWLDDAVLHKQETNHAKPKQAETIAPPSLLAEGRSSYAQKSIVPIKSHAVTRGDSNRNTVDKTPDASKEAKSTNKPPNGPFSRSQYHKQRRQHYQRAAEAEASSTSVSEEDVDEEEVVRKASAASYDVYSVDSGGEMFEDSDSDAGNGKKQSSVAKRNAMREYVVNTTHQRSSNAASAKRTGKVDGEDLDEWLDSVIE